MRIFVRDPAKKDEAQKAFKKFCYKIDQKFVESRMAPQEAETPNIFKNGNRNSVPKEDYKTPQLGLGPTITTRSCSEFLTLDDESDCEESPPNR